LISLVGAANSPSGSSINFQGINAPYQFATKMNKKRVPTYGIHGRYSYSPIWSLAIPATYSKTDSTKFCNPFGICSRFRVPAIVMANIVAVEIVVSVLCLLVPLFIPLTDMVLGIFASSLQAQEI
jgi:hypothetical protein